MEWILLYCPVVYDIWCVEFVTSSIIEVGECGEEYLNYVSVDLIFEISDVKILLRKSEIYRVFNAGLNHCATNLSSDIRKCGATLTQWHVKYSAALSYLWTHS